MQDDSAVEEHHFQAETKKLLHIVVHSLYTNKEIFLRELISNAADALDQARFEVLRNPQLYSDSYEPQIRITANQSERTLTISDNGLGMSREDLIRNLGTIAHSGTQEFLASRLADSEDNELTSMIGQFGVGFYSAFMVAERIEVTTRRLGDEDAHVWASDGTGTFKVSAAHREQHGTTVVLHLRAVDKDIGIEDYTDDLTVGAIVRRHSDFVPYPIVWEGATTERAVESRILNSRRPLWSRGAAAVSEEDTRELFRRISGSGDAPAETILFHGEGMYAFDAILFIPEKAPDDMLYHGFEYGLRLYSRSNLVFERKESLLPRHLRFVTGVVEAPDLPLNISRQTLQEDRLIEQIRAAIGSKILKTFSAILRDDRAKYEHLWREFGKALKEGVSSDYKSREQLLDLLLFHSSRGDGFTTLADYVARMKEGQDVIYYLTGDSVAAVSHAPHIEGCRELGYEVLFLVDQIDELLVQSLFEFRGIPLRSAEKGEFERSPSSEPSPPPERATIEEDDLSGLFDCMQRHLDQYVKVVRASKRLRSSAVCLVGAPHDYSPRLERLLLKGKGGGLAQRRIMELNMQHPAVRRLVAEYRLRPDGRAVEDFTHLFLGQGLLSEGAELPDPNSFNERVARLMGVGFEDSKTETTR